MNNSNNQLSGSYRQASGSEFLAADDLPADRDICLVISGASVEVVKAPNGGREKNMVCLLFEKTNKKLALNVTNGKAISRVAGSTQVEDWPGTKICLHRVFIKAFGDPQLPAIRVRPNKPGG